MPTLLPGEATAPVTQADAAKMLNVSERSVRAAVSVRDKGVPELKEKLRAGEIAVSAAAEIAKQPVEEQSAIVALPPDERVEKLKAMRAEVKAIRESLPRSPLTAQPLLSATMEPFKLSWLGDRRCICRMMSCSL